MTIKRSWSLNIPVLNKEVPRSKILASGYSERVWIYKGHNPDEWRIGAKIPVRFTVIAPDEIEVHNEYPYEAGISTYFLEGDAINEWAHSGDMRSLDDVIRERVIVIDWEPTLPSQARK